MEKKHIPITSIDDISFFSIFFLFLFFWKYLYSARSSISFSSIWFIIKLLRLNHCNSSFVRSKLNLFLINFYFSPYFTNYQTRSGQTDDYTINTINCQFVNFWYSKAKFSFLFSTFFLFSIKMFYIFFSSPKLRY